MSELQINCQNNLIQTLEYFASVEKQLDYKKSVPFVHIPYELICSWDGDFVKTQRWFREIWTEEEWKVLCKFDKRFNEICDQIPNNNFFDIPEVLEDVRWAKLIELAKETIINLEIESKEN